MVYVVVVAETALTKRIERYLKLRGAYWVKQHGSARGRRGVPDLACTFRGISVWFEVKNPGGTGRLSKQQELEIAKIRKAGGLVAVVESVEDVAETLDKVDDVLPPQSIPFAA